jgi:hypothetical protein
MSLKIMPREAKPAPKVKSIRFGCAGFTGQALRDQFFSLSEQADRAERLARRAQ